MKPDDGNGREKYEKEMTYYDMRHIVLCVLCINQEYRRRYV